MADPIVIAHAGSLLSVLTQGLGPAFTSATGEAWTNIPGPAVGLANRIRAGELAPDVYMSADAEANRILMEPAEDALVRWFLVMAATRMVLAYHPQSRIAADLDAAAAGTLPWYDVLQRPGFALWRSDPRTDPGGYRALFVCQLAEQYYGLPGLAERLLGDDHNEAQIAMGMPAGPGSAAADAMLVYVSIAQQLGLPCIQLPEAIDLSNPALADHYRAARYTNPLGQMFYGTPAVYSITILANAKNPAAAEAFASTVLSADGRAAFAQHGFLPAPILVGGAATAVPQALQPLIEGTYAG